MILDKVCEWCRHHLTAAHVVVGDIYCMECWVSMFETVSCDVREKTCTPIPASRFLWLPIARIITIASWQSTMDKAS